MEDKGFFSSFIKGFKRGLPEAYTNVLSGYAFLSDLLGNPKPELLNAIKQRENETQLAILRDIAQGYNPQDLSYSTGLTLPTTIGAMIPTAAAGIGTSAVTGGMALPITASILAGMGTSFGLEGGQAYQDLYGKNDDIEKSVKVGAINSLLEVIPDTILGRMFGRVGKALKGKLKAEAASVLSDYLGSIFTEVPTEIAQDYVQYIHDKSQGFNPEQTAKVTAISTALLGAAPTLINLIAAEPDIREDFIKEVDARVKDKAKGEKPLKPEEIKDVFKQSLKNVIGKHPEKVAEVVTEQLTPSEEQTTQEEKEENYPIAEYKQPQEAPINFLSPEDTKGLTPIVNPEMVKEEYIPLINPELANMEPIPPTTSEGYKNIFLTPEEIAKAQKRMEEIPKGEKPLIYLTPEWGNIKDNARLSEKYEEAGKDILGILKKGGTVLFTTEEGNKIYITPISRNRIESFIISDNNLAGTATDELTTEGIRRILSAVDGEFSYSQISKKKYHKILEDLLNTEVIPNEEKINTLDLREKYKYLPEHFWINEKGEIEDLSNKNIQPFSYKGIDFIVFPYGSGWEIAERRTGHSPYINEKANTKEDAMRIIKEIIDKEGEQKIKDFYKSFVQKNEDIYRNFNEVQEGSNALADKIARETEENAKKGYALSLPNLPDDIYISIDENGQLSTQKINGRIYPFSYKGKEFFIFKSEKGNWGVIDKKSRMPLIFASSKNKAINETKRVIDNILKNKNAYIKINEKITIDPYDRLVYNAIGKYRDFYEGLKKGQELDTIDEKDKEIFKQVIDTIVNEEGKIDLSLLLWLNPFTMPFKLANSIYNRISNKVPFSKKDIEEARKELADFLKMNNSQFKSKDDEKIEEKIKKDLKNITEKDFSKWERIAVSFTQPFQLTRKYKEFKKLFKIEEDRTALRKTLINYFYNEISQTFSSLTNEERDILNDYLITADKFTYAEYFNDLLNLAKESGVLDEIGKDNPSLKDLVPHIDEILQKTIYADKINDRIANSIKAVRNSVKNAFWIYNIFQIKDLIEMFDKSKARLYQKQIEDTLIFFKSIPLDIYYKKGLNTLQKVMQDYKGEDREQKTQYISTFLSEIAGQPVELTKETIEPIFNALVSKFNERYAYIPHIRKDYSYGVIVRDTNGKVIYRRHLPKGRAIVLQKELLKRGYEAELIKAGKIPDEDYQDFDRDFTLDLLSKLLEEKGKDTGVMNVLKIMADFIKKRGWLSHILPRSKRYIAGFEKNIEESLYKYFSGLAGVVSKKEASKRFSDLYSSIPIDAKLKRNYIRKTIKDILRNADYGDEIGSIISNIVFMKFISFRLITALLNLSAVPVSSYPTILEEFKKRNINISLKALLDIAAKGSKKALLYSKIAKEIKEKGGGTPYTIYKYLQEKYGFTKEEYNQFMDYLKRDIGAAFTPQRVEEYLENVGANKYPKMFLAINRLNRFGGVFLSWTENFMRKSIYLGVYDYLKNKGYNKENIGDLADYIQNLSFGVFGRANQPEFLRGGGAKAILRSAFYTFKNWAFHFFSNYMHWLKLGLTENEWKPFIVANFSLALFSGIPLFYLISYAIGKAMGEDPEKWAEKNNMKSVYKVLEKGLPYLIGIDLSNRFDILPTGNYPLQKLASGEVSSALGSLMLGAPASMLEDTVKGLNLIGKGRTEQGLYKMAPLGIRQIADAFREYGAGYTQTGTPLAFNKEIYKPELSERVLSFFGIPSARLTDLKDRARKVENVREKMRSLKRDISILYNKIQKKRDGRYYKRLFNLIRKYNEKVKQWNDYFGTSIVKPITSISQIRLRPYERQIY